jgi:hypothetical protein
MQVKTAPPRNTFTDQQVEDALGYLTGGVVRWGVDVLDEAGAAKTEIIYDIDTDPEWNEGTHYGTEGAGDLLMRIDDDFIWGTSYWEEGGWT